MLDRHGHRQQIELVNIALQIDFLAEREMRRCSARDRGPLASECCFDCRGRARFLSREYCSEVKQ